MSFAKIAGSAVLHPPYASLACPTRLRCRKCVLYGEWLRPRDRTRGTFGRNGSWHRLLLCSRAALAAEDWENLSHARNDIQHHRPETYPYGTAGYARVPRERSYAAQRCPSKHRTNSPPYGPDEFKSPQLPTTRHNLHVAFLGPLSRDQPLAPVLEETKTLEAMTSCIMYKTSSCYDAMKKRREKTKKERKKGGISVSGMRTRFEYVT